MSKVKRLVRQALEDRGASLVAIVDGGKHLKVNAITGTGIAFHFTVAYNPRSSNYNYLPDWIGQRIRQEERTR